MRTRIKSPIVAVLTTSLLFSACGSDDPTGPGNDNLSEAEAMAVFGEILSAMMSVGFSAEVSRIPADGPSLSLAPGGISPAVTTITFDESFDCTGGGTIAITGNMVSDVDDDTGAGSFTYQIVETPANCGVTTESGASYRVNGSPNIQIAGAFSFDEESEPVGTFDMSYTGGINWSSTTASGSGSCTIDLDYELNMNTFSGSVTGQMCGHSISETFDAID